MVECWHPVVFAFTFQHQNNNSSMGAQKKGSMFVSKERMQQKDDKIAMDTNIWKGKE